MRLKSERLKDLYNQLSRPPIDKSIYDLLISKDKDKIKYATNYQRNFVWSNVDSTYLIETILLHGIIPPIVALETNEGVEILDRKTKV